MLLIVYIGVFYLVVGFSSLLIALLFIELGRPKDLIKSGLLILLGTFLIIYKNIFTFKISIILILNTALLIFYISENFLFRWNQLLEKEKFDIKSFSGFKKNFLIIYKIINFDLKNLFFNNKFKNIFTKTSIKKKWVREKDINNSSSQEESSKEYIKNIQTADFSKKDIIKDVKNKTENNKID